MTTGHTAKSSPAREASRRAVLSMLGWIGLGFASTTRAAVTDRRPQTLLESPRNRKIVGVEDGQIVVEWQGDPFFDIFRKDSLRNSVPLKGEARIRV